MRLWKRPVFANNVIGAAGPRLLARLPASQRFLANIVARGDELRGRRATPATDDLDAAGRPHWDSHALGIANRHYAPATDFTGRPRDAEPDIGAYEWRN